MAKAVIGSLVALIIGTIGYALWQSQTRSTSQQNSTPSPLPTISTQATQSTQTTEETQAMTATISTNFGDIKVELYNDAAPRTVENFTTLARKGYYDGVIFHRVIKEFMIQGGDPTGTGSGGESAFGDRFEDEINPWSLGLSEEVINYYQQLGYEYRKDLTSRKIEAGTLAMANAGPGTNGSQFFIVTEEAQPHLDGRHTAFGKVVEGMDVVKKIAAVKVGAADRPVEEVKIKTVTVAE